MYVIALTIHFNAPKHDGEQNNLWLVALHINQTAFGQSLANESCQFEGLATRD